MSPHDLYDWGGIDEDILLDLPWQGSTRKVLVRPDRNGYMYVIDRITGQVLSANSFVHITTTTGVDLKTGQLQHVEEKNIQTGEETINVCPMAPSAKDWQPSSFSPRTGAEISHNTVGTAASLSLNNDSRTLMGYAERQEVVVWPLRKA
jgi:glucose dehydrogenase